jgi:hypothetical protein
VTDDFRDAAADFATKSAGSRVDPVSVARTALTDPEEPHHVSRATPDNGRSRDSGSIADRSNGDVVDPLAVTRKALEAEEDSVATPETDRPNRGRWRWLLARLVARPRRSDYAEHGGAGRGATGSGASTPSRTPAPPPGHDEATSESPDPGWVFHESGPGGFGFEGWLYHYADGTRSSEDGTLYGYSESGAVTDATPEPEPELEPEPVAVAVASAEPTPEPEPEPEPDSDSDSDSANIPGFVEYSPSDLRSHVLGTVLVLAAVASVLTLFLSGGDDTRTGFLVAGGLAVVALLAFWALVSWDPTTVSIRDGILEVSSGRREDQFDLRDPHTEVELGERPGSPSWRAVFKAPDSRTTTIGSQQVKARQFTEIVEHHRSRPRVPEKPPEKPADTDS